MDKLKQPKSVISLRAVTAALVGAAAACLFVASTRPTHASPPAGYTLTWSDEFTGAVGSAPNSANWSYDLGAGGWGNNELQTYTNSTTNASIQSDSSAPNGRALYITATKSGGNYMSARIKTMGKEAPLYGYFESDIETPQGSGLWPAWWMLGASNIGWPQEGEIDIFELFGANPSNEFSDFYYGTGSNLQHWGGNITINPNGYHTYAILWTSTTTQEYYDGQGYDSHSNPGNPFNQAFYFLANLAVGGNPGGVGGNTVFPSSLKLGYVRVYEPSSSSSSTTSSSSSSNSSSNSSSSGGSGFGNGTYSIFPQCATGSRLDDSANSTANGNKIQIWQANGTSAQNWAFSTTNVSPAGDWNLGVDGPFCLQESGTGNGAATELWGCNGANSQSWNITKDSSPSGYWQLHPASNLGECLDVTGANPANGTVVDTYTCNSTNAQQWGGM